MLLAHAAAQNEVATFRSWAMTPPMGWNSWDCYYSSVTEKEVMQNAQYLVDNDLVRHGWEYVVIDIRWYCNHPSLGGGNYNQNGTQDYVLDEYGRYLPSPTRFPSCMKDGKNIGFKAIADKLHEMGLKFGIHIMRGVPKSVVGSSYMIFTQNITDDTGRLSERAVIIITVFISRINNTAVYRLQTITHVRQCT